MKVLTYEYGIPENSWVYKMDHNMMREMKF